MISQALNWLAGGHSFGAGGVVDSGTNYQAGEDFPQWQIQGIPIPSTVSLDDRLRSKNLTPFPVLDQGPVGICTGTAGITAASYAWWDKLPQGNPPPWRQFSPEPTFAWSKTAVHGGTPTPSGGSTVANVARALRDFGLVPMARFPSVDLSRVDGVRAMRWSSRPGLVPATLQPVAALRLVKIWRVNHNIQQIREVLTLGGGVFASVPWTFTQTDQNGMAILTPAVHAMAIIGRIERGPTGRPCLAFRQSYGTRIFAFNRSRPHSRFPVLGVGLVEEAQAFAAISDRRVAFGFFPERSSHT